MSMAQSGSPSPAAAEASNHWAPHGPLLTACLVGLNVLMILLIFFYFWWFFSRKPGPSSSPVPSRRRRGGVVGRHVAGDLPGGVQSPARPQPSGHRVLAARVRVLQQQRRRREGGRLRGVHRGVPRRRPGAPPPAVRAPVPRRVRGRVAAAPRHMPALPRQRRRPRRPRCRAQERPQRRRRRGVPGVRQDRVDESARRRARKQGWRST